MKFFPVRFNGFLFQQDNDRVTAEFDEFDWDIAGISTNNTQRANKRPKYSGTVLGGVTKVVTVNLKDVDRDRDLLVTAMDTSGSEQIALYSKDILGNEWYVLAKCVGLNTENTDGKTGQFGYIFEIDDPTWIAVAEREDLWSGPIDGEEHTITVGGNQDTYPYFDISFGAPDYYPYTQYIKNYNPIFARQTDGIDITNGGWNHAAVVAAGKSLASGNDVRVIVDGAEVPRWVGGGGWNNASTKIFIYLTWKPGQFMPLRTAIAGTGTPARIEWAVTADVKKALKVLPKSGIIRVGTEEMSYKNLDSILCQASVVARPIRGLAIAAHSIGDICWWVEHDIRIIYGNASAAAPVYSDVRKPVYDLTTSTNTSRVYTAFADTANLRVGSWKRQVLDDGIGKLSRVYSGNQAAVAEVNPATDMGMEIASFQSQGRARPETAELAWLYNHPAEIISVTTTGEKYKLSATTTWPTAAELQSSPNGKENSWVREWNEVVPASAATWTALANTTTEAVPSGTRFVRFHLFGSVNAIVGNVARMEIDSCTVVIDSTKIIQVAMNGEIDNYQFAAEFRNLTTGESLFIDYPAREDDTMDIDTLNMTAIYKGMNAIRAISWDSIRTDWLRFVPGPNVIKYIANPPGYLIITTRTHDRAL